MAHKSTHCGEPFHSFVPRWGLSNQAFLLKGCFWTKYILFKKFLWLIQVDIWQKPTKYYKATVIVQSLSCVWLFGTPWTAACQDPLSSAISQSLLRFMSIELVMLSNHLILCHPLLLLPSIFSSIRVFSNETALRIRWPKSWSFSFKHQSFQWIFRVHFL